jgi:acyl-CoA reductase-like NAD-dependent aldehyde dehydrogenase
VALAAAREAFDDGRWTGLPPAKRSRMLQTVADLIARDAEHIAWVDTLDHGKPLRHAQAEMVQAADCFRYFSGWVDKIYGETIPSRPDRFIYSRREPVGVCGQIVPWNFPFLMAVRKVAAALAAGNAVVLKPAEQTPLSAVWLMRLLAEAGVPAGAANLVQGVGEVTGAAIVDHPDVDKVDFTGSTEVGRLIMRNSSVHLHKLTLELGGKAPFLVFDDADLDLVAKRASFAIFYNAGEVCTAGSRLVVDASVRQELVERVATYAAKTTVGPGWHEGVRMGPLVSDEHFDRVSGYVEVGRGEGAELVVGGGRVEDYDTGYFFQPTVFDGVDPGRGRAQEEEAGAGGGRGGPPAAGGAGARAHAGPKGLAASIWTSDVGRAHRVAARIHAGTIWVNTYGEYDNAVSYGGYKHSGFGRELGRHAAEAYTQTKHVWVAT